MVDRVKGGGRTPPPHHHQPWTEFPSWWNVRQKVAIATLYVLCCTTSLDLLLPLLIRVHSCLPLISFSSLLLFLPPSLLISFLVPFLPILCPPPFLFFTHFFVFSVPFLLPIYPTPIPCWPRFYLLYTVIFPDDLPSNRVISSPFSHKTFFFTKLCEGTPYFFSDRKFIKKLL